MPEIMISGPVGRLEARFSPGKSRNAPVALVLHPHPQHGGTMNNRITYAIYQSFVERGFGVMRFNFRGVGKSQGLYDRGEGELADAASALDWLETNNPEAAASWIAGFSFGAWVGMQLLMRRPEVSGFIAVSPPTTMFDFSFLAPCPVSGLMVHGSEDELVSDSAVQKLAQRLAIQKDIVVKHQKIEGANHFYTKHLDQLMKMVGTYIDNSGAFEAKREMVRLRGQVAPMAPPPDSPREQKKAADIKLVAVVGNRFSELDNEAFGDRISPPIDLNKIPVASQDAKTKIAPSTLIKIGNAKQTEKTKSTAAASTKASNEKSISAKKPVEITKNGKLKTSAKGESESLSVKPTKTTKTTKTVVSDKSDKTSKSSQRVIATIPKEVAPKTIAKSKIASVFQMVRGFGKNKSKSTDKSV